MKFYIVLTPQLEKVIPILDDGTGPLEQWHDSYLVKARNRKDARWEAWNLAKKNRANHYWPVHVDLDGVHPLTGTTVYDIPTEELEDIIGYFPYKEGYTNYREKP